MRKIHYIPFALIGAVFLACASVPKEGVNNGASSPPPTTAVEAAGQGAEGDITLAEYDQIQIGMTYDQVTSIIGSPGKVTSEMNSGSVQMKGYQWYGKEVNFMQGNAIITFDRGKVVNRVQFGLV